MSPVLVIFIASGVGLIGFTSLKAIQHKAERPLFFSQSRHKVEVLLQRNINFMKEKKDSLPKPSLGGAVRHGGGLVKRLAVHVDKKLQQRPRKIVNLVKGKQDIEARPKTSQFLHTIAEVKEVREERKEGDSLA